MKTILLVIDCCLSFLSGHLLAFIFFMPNKPFSGIITSIACILVKLFIRRKGFNLMYGLTFLSFSFFLTSLFCLFLWFISFGAGYGWVWS